MKKDKLNKKQNINVSEYATQLGFNFNEIKTEEIEFTPPKAEELDNDISVNMKNFTSLLNSLSSTEDKKKALWKQIYENALIDRRNAYILFGDLYNIVAGNANEHGLHGANMAKYLERMSKANEQLIKLAELVSDEVTSVEAERFNEDNMYEYINKQ